jgi:RluA family pseudouridine synthase
LPKSSKPTTKHLPKDLVILYEDRDILVVDKPAGLLTIATEGEKTNTAYYLLTDYVRKGYAKSLKRLFIVHRLDRDVSGILIFAKTAEAKETLQTQWPDVTKKYLAVVHGLFEKQADTLSSYLTENREFHVYSTLDKSVGKHSRTAYKVLKEKGNLSLLEIELLTGRKHQIRVHMADCRHPIVGDKKYGEGKQAYPRLALHAFSIAFLHPYNSKPLYFETSIPAYFNELVGNIER